MAYISEANGWLISYPGGQRQDDPASVVAVPGGTPGQIGQNPGLTYDHLTATWEPVPYWWLAPSGHVYAYEEFPSYNVFSVTIPQGKVTPVIIGGGDWYLIDTEDGGVYLTSNTKPGAWYVPFGGQVQQVVDHGSWQKFFAGALWGIDRSGNLVRHDMATGTDANWGTFPGFAEIAGFDWHGNPAITTSLSIPSDDSNQAYSLVLVHPGAAHTVVWSGKGSRAEANAIGDARGLWFVIGGGLVGAPGHGLYLWTADQGARIISTDEGHVAGGCW